MKRSIMLVGATLLALAVVCSALPNRSQRQNVSPTIGQSPKETSSSSTEVALVPTPDGQAVPGKAGASNFEGTSANESRKTPDSQQKAGDLPDAPQSFGTTPPVKATATPQAVSVMEALKTGAHVERLSAMLPPKPFDKAAFDADPAAYLRVTEPGRVFQTAQSADGVPVLTAVSDRMVRVKQGDEIKLSVKAVPNAPVSWTSFDLGEFKESELSSVTVLADKDGTASVTFVATSGTLNDVNVLAGSPLASGQCKFVIDVAQK